MGVLSFARLNGSLAEAGVLNGLVATAAHLEVFQRDQVQRWAEMVAGASVWGESPAPSTWVGELTVKAAPEQRAQWLEAVADHLERMTPPARSRVWSAWLATYWASRIKRVPMVLTEPEASGLAAVAPLMSAADFPAAVDLVLQSPASVGGHGHVVRHLSDELIASMSEDVGKYLTHLMRNTTERHWDYRLRPILAKLVEVPGDWRAVREAALGLGIYL